MLLVRSDDPASLSIYSPFVSLNVARAICSEFKLSPCTNLGVFTQLVYCSRGMISSKQPTSKNWFLNTDVHNRGELVPAINLMSRMMSRNKYDVWCHFPSASFNVWPRASFESFRLYQHLMRTFQQTTTDFPLHRFMCLINDAVGSTWMNTPGYVTRVE